MENNLPQTLLEAVKYFADPDVCLKFTAELRWPNGPVCPRCQAAEPSFISTRRVWKCKACKKQFSVKVGTIFEDSPLPLEKWLAAVWLIASAKNGISSHEIHRALGVTQKSAWFMLHRIRLAMQTGTFNRQLSGDVESDETFIGGKAKFMHAAKRDERIHGRGTVGKTVVQGILERGGEVRVEVVPDQKKGTLQGNIHKHVAPGASISTDALRSYVGLSTNYIHGMVDHAAGQYVNGKIHTNGLENFWALVKRCLKGTYVAVAPWHLYRYLDEETWRFNARHGKDGARFVRVLGRIVGKRLTYKELTGKLQAESGATS